MAKHREPTFAPGHVFYAKLGLSEGRGSWMFQLRVLGVEGGKYVCKIEGCVVEPKYINPGSHVKSMLGKKLKLRKGEIIHGTNRTPILFE